MCVRCSELGLQQAAADVIVQISAAAVAPPLEPRAFADCSGAVQWRPLAAAAAACVLQSENSVDLLVVREASGGAHINSSCQAAPDSSHSLIVLLDIFLFQPPFQIE